MKETSIVWKEKSQRKPQVVIKMLVKLFVAKTILKNGLQIKRLEHFQLNKSEK